ncbi:MAG: hypothetical protein QM784_24750 [Polyangiaceae bacterium]
MGARELVPLLEVAVGSPSDRDRTVRRLTIFLFPWLLACSSIERAAECRAIAEIVNGGAERVEDALQQTPADTPAVERESRRLAREIRAATVSDASLRNIARDLSDNFSRLADAAAVRSSTVHAAEPNVDVARNWYAVFATRHAQLVKALKGQCRR